MACCWVCGKSNISLFSREGEEWCGKCGAPLYRTYCSECLEKEKEREQEENRQYLKLRARRMYSSAMRILERQGYEMNRARDVFLPLLDYVTENTSKFDSTDEVIAAAVLVDNEIKAKIHFPVGKYEADFCLPEHKIVLEIDGAQHSARLDYDRKRDDEIRAILGSEWEVARIPAKYIEENAKMLIDAIFAIQKEKKRLRKQNGGMLPNSYSKRERARNWKR